MKNVIQHKRHIAKTITYRLFSSGVGFCIFFLASGSIKWGATFSIVELIYKPIQYYIHERIWYKYIKFGVSKENDIT